MGSLSFPYDGFSFVLMPFLKGSYPFFKGLLRENDGEHWNLLNCKENIVLKRADPKEFLQKGLLSTMVALEKAF